MFITSKEVETVIGKELADRLCEWLRTSSPISCIVEQGAEDAIRFNVDEAMDFSKIKMHSDALKREFFPHIAKLKQYMASTPARPDLSA
ncbi:hypothetical protein LOH54_00085 [Sulfurimonas sp. HSL-3221]|uniref:hypothetical protein n=1 Tax=Sulfurimonadaceae TaxID=2771471 RepID=UPI001E332D97|nr:hypothetical protein [Sulfurimonas sp. HSL-3221]UFS62547.1 hypothetical protein LOH54_00085 [Sulfurimonas sp. HSL-3221]